MPDSTSAPANLAVELKSPNALLIRLSGDWDVQASSPGVERVEQAIRENPSVRALEFDSAELGRWGSRLVVLVQQCSDYAREKNLEFRSQGLPEGVQTLLRLSNAVPEKTGARQNPAKTSFLYKTGDYALQGWQGLREMLSYFGQSAFAFGRMLRGAAQFRWQDTWLIMQQSGPQALPIVALINFLVGLILAFVGAVQLGRFGAAIYVADLVAIATVREMGCIMTGIIMCGRTGAAFAAQLGTMKVNQEISALHTFGISSVEFLVLPRLLALVLMMPLLCAFADLISIAGGFVVSTTMLDVSPTVYIDRTINAIELTSFLLGIGKAAFFGFLVAYMGCLRGLQCGNNAAAVGESTTRAVVAGITAIIASDGIFAVLCNALHI